MDGMRIVHEPVGLRGGKNPKPWAVMDGDLCLAWMETLEGAEFVTDYLEDLREDGLWQNLRAWFMQIETHDVERAREQDG